MRSDVPTAGEQLVFEFVAELATVGAFKNPDALCAERAERRDRRANDARVHPMRVARRVSGEGSVAGQIDLDADRLPLDLVFDPADLVEHLAELRGQVLVVAADLGDGYRFRTEPRGSPVCSALLQPLELCWVPQPLHLPQDQKVPTNRAASVLCTLFVSSYSIETAPHSKSFGIVTSVLPSASRSDRSTAAPSGVSRRAERNLPATRSVIASAGWSE